MKTLQMALTLALLTTTAFFYGCGSDDDDVNTGPSATGMSETYDLGDTGLGISGTARFEEYTDGSTVVTISISNTPSGGIHHAHIHMNTAAEGGGIAFPLTDVNGTTGTSVTTITTDGNGNAVTYADLTSYNGYINVHLSADELGTIVAQGDIGQNALTGSSESYTLAEVAGSGVSGTAVFAERNNGNALVLVTLTGTPDGGDHPMHIHDNDVATGGPVAIPLTNVNGTTGRSATSVDGSLYSYSTLIAFDGYINVHLSPDNLATIVAQGNIGANAQ